MAQDGAKLLIAAVCGKRVEAKRVKTRFHGSWRSSYGGWLRGGARIRRIRLVALLLLQTVDLVPQMLQLRLELVYPRVLGLDCKPQLSHRLPGVKRRFILAYEAPAAARRARRPGAITLFCMSKKAITSIRRSEHSRTLDFLTLQELQARAT